MRLWHHLLTTHLLEAATLHIRHGWEADALIEEHGAPARLHTAEVIARAASVHGLNLPPEDPALEFRLRYNRHPLHHQHGGVILYTPDGRAAWALGDGRTIESLGNTLGLLAHPEGRYTRAYTVPGLTSH